VTYELADPMKLHLPEGTVHVSKITVALSQKVRAYGVLNGRAVVVESNVWHGMCNEVSPMRILEMLPSMDYSIR
jgi:hypothetical protein